MSAPAYNNRVCGKRYLLIAGREGDIMKYFRIMSIIFLLTLLTELLSLHVTKAAEPNWITTDKRCKVWNPNPQPNESVTWSGECINGKAHGNGILIWYKNGIEFSRDIMSTENGSFMEEGVFKAKVESSSIELILQKCDNITSYRGITVFVNEKIDLSLNHVVESILEKAAQFAIEKCPRNQKFSNIAVTIFQGKFKDLEELYQKYNTPSPSNYNQIKYYKDLYKNEVVSARNYDNDKLTWSEYNNKPLQKRRSEEKAKYDAIVKTLQEEKSRREIEARRAEEERKKQEVRKRYNEFVKKNGVQAWPSGNELSANPFVYEGKTVAIRAEFKEMLTPTQGIFDYFVVSNIPKGLFTSSRTNVVLAGRVIGKTEVKMGLEMSVPHLKFVGVHFCKNYDCSDILP
jgi:hypothetical protein